MSQTKINIKSGAGYNNQGAKIKKRITPEGSLEQEVAGNVIVLPGNTKDVTLSARKHDGRGPKQIEAPINYCKKEKMSICTAEKGPKQEKCSFYEKSSRESRCMYFIEGIADGHCDCLKAQLYAKK